MLYTAVLVCSDPDCAERVDAVGTLAELETLACECGCGLAVVGWPDPVEGVRPGDAGPGGEVVVLRRRVAPERHAA